MRIGGDMSNSMLRYGNIAEQRTAGTLEKLASGYRVNRAGDDAAGLSIYEKIKAQIQGMDKASGNTADGINMIRTAEGALDGTHGTLQRMRELALQSASDTNETGIDRGALQAEYGQMMSELDDIGTATRFNEKQLFAASVAGSDVQFAPDSDFALQTGPNRGDETVLSIDAMVSGALGIGDTDIGTGEGARSAVEQLDDAINRVSMQRAALGAKESALSYKAANLDIAAENQTAAGSRIKDTDIAADTVKLSVQKMLMQATTAMTAQTNLMMRNGAASLMR